MKGFNGSMFIDSDRVDGGRHQVMVCVQAKSVAQMVRITGESRGSINNYWSDCLNDEMIEALRHHPEGTMLVRRWHPKDTIDGQTGWVVA